MNLGDLVILKLMVLPRPKCEIGGAFPHLDIAVLRKMPKKTLGGAYAEFLDEHRIAPLDPTRKGSAYALRFTATHDLHHVVTGFDTTLAGEIGVLAFNVGQDGAGRCAPARDREDVLRDVDAVERAEDFSKRARRARARTRGGERAQRAARRVAR
jgi:hypothetical protein